MIQTLFGLAITAFDSVELTGKQGYEVAIWARRLRQAARSSPNILAFLGIDSVQRSKYPLRNYPSLAAILAGGHDHATPRFISWEIFAAKALYYIFIPMIHITLGMCIVDTWQYFFYRWMHMKQFLYTTTHARHQRLYVPHAYGALYNHPLEGFVLETLGTAIACLATRMTARPRNVVLHLPNDQNRGRSLWIRVPLGSAATSDEQQYCLPCRAPPALGHKDEFQPAVLYILGPSSRDDVDKWRRGDAQERHLTLPCRRSLVENRVPAHTS